MPAPARISASSLVAAASDVLEEHGVAGLTMAAVAARLGVRPPSLYKHVRDRDDVLARVRSAALDALASALGDVRGTTPSERLLAQARAARAFARRRPEAMALLFSPAVRVAERDELAAAVAPLLDACTALVGEETALAAARTITAWMHGFSEMEHAGAFRLGGDVDAAYEHGAAAIVTGLASLGHHD